MRKRRNIEVRLPCQWLAKGMTEAVWGGSVEPPRIHASVRMQIILIRYLYTDPHSASLPSAIQAPMG